MAADSTGPQPGPGASLAPAASGMPTAPPPSGTPPPPTSYWVQPEQRRAGPAPGFAYAGFWIRLLAYVIDAIPLLVVGVLLLAPALASMADSFRDIPLPPRGSSVNSEAYRAYQVLVMQRMSDVMAPLYPLYGLWQLIAIVYFVGFWTWRGQTPGMILLGLRIAREADGAPPGLARSILRYVGYFISQLPLFLGFIWIAFDSRKQGWHDKIAGTVVVRRTG
jgi:uncharacterized RDD family membrane protein YckC